MRRDDLGLRHGVERAASPVQHQGNVRERLEPRAETAGGLADALGHGPDLARALGHDGHDLVGLAELDRAQDDALFLVERHGGIVALASWPTPSANVAKSWRCGVPAGSGPLGAHRVPDGLDLHERRDLVGALGGVGERVDVAGPDARASRSRRRARSASAPGRRATPVTSIAFTSMCPASHGTSSARQPGEDVHDAAGDVRGREHLGERHRGQRRRLAREDDRRVPAHDRRRQPRDEAEQRLLPRRDDADHARRLGDREVEVRAGDRVRAARAPGAILSAQPAYQTHRSIAASTPARRVRRRPRRRARTRTGPGGPPSARPRGTGPAPGCRRSCAAHPGCAARAATTASRRSLREARAARASDRPSARRTSYERPDSERGNAPPMKSFAVAACTGTRPSVTAPLRRARGRARARAGRPRGRTRSPCSRRTARTGRTG